jgi:thymidylate synthase
VRQYHNLLKEILDNGIQKSDRTGTGTISIFGHQSKYDLSEGFPLVTTKKMFTKGIIYELLWFLSGSTNINNLDKSVHKWWAPWADSNGNIANIYPKQWVRLETPSGTINQIQNVINSIKNNPDDRGHIVSAWNVGEIDSMALRPCHALFQFYVANGKLSCNLYQRSGDAFLGVPVNIASYSLLTHMIAQVCNLDVGTFVHTLGDAHLYLNHINQARLQLSRQCLDLSQLRLNPSITSIFDFKFEDIEIIGYNSHEAIKGEMSV